MSGNAFHRRRGLLGGRRHKGRVTAARGKSLLPRSFGIAFRLGKRTSALCQVLVAGRKRGVAARRRLHPANAPSLRLVAKCVSAKFGRRQARNLPRETPKIRLLALTLGRIGRSGGTEGRGDAAARLVTMPETIPDDIDALKVALVAEREARQQAEARASGAEA